MYQELSYDELKGVLESWLNPTGEDEEDDSVSSNELSSTKTTTSHDMGGSVETKTTETVDTKKLDDVASAFDDLFNS
jgi:hypothetical protein